MPEKLRDDVARFLTTKLGWKKLRGVQDKTLPAILSGENVLIIAGTASGKTEAAMMPILSMMLNDSSRSLSCIYFAPLKALINDIQARLDRIFRPFGLEVSHWHGDVSPNEKKTAIRNSDVLVITPESMEGILTSKRAISRVFREIRFVVIDEVHSFVDSPRGAQLVCLIERLQTLSKHEIQRVAMSATVGNPELLGEWVSGSSSRNMRIVVDRSPFGRELEVIGSDEIRPSDYLVNLVKESPGSKTLVFAYSRAQAEEFSALMRRLGVEAAVHHSSISKSLRETIEETFKNDKGMRVVVATSTLEMGIDIGDVDRVVFLEVPYSAASFVQRFGRSGRKSRIARATMFLTDDHSVYRAIGILQMLKDKSVEGLYPLKFYPQLLGQQLISLTYQQSILDRSSLELLTRAFPFREIKRQVFRELLDHLTEKDYISKRPTGELIPGSKSREILESGMFKKDFVVLFPIKSEYTVFHNGVEVGTLHPLFVEALENLAKNDKSASFLLAGKTWDVKKIDHSLLSISVGKGKGSKRPAWISFGPRFSFDFAMAVRRGILNRDFPDYANLSEGAEEEINLLIRNEETGLSADSLVTIHEKETEERKNAIVMSTYAGDTGNLLIKYLLKLVDPNVERVSHNWKEISFKSSKRTNLLKRELIERLELGESSVKESIAQYLLENPSEMKTVYSCTGDKLREYATDEIIAMYLAEYIYDQRVVDMLINSA
ncbi:MAG TPA: DEAD/DEAH box helicase [Kosmotogaceae bacterium]|nr:MAG: DEAD/DEAH box helicase domain protein [Thermotogales bacterium 46_20]HAA85069.1 DEAD/DEAH box helicase [Kosmotogaceae bacterium]